MRTGAVARQELLVRRVAGECIEPTSTTRQDAAQSTHPARMKARMRIRRLGISLHERKQPNPADLDCLAGLGYAPLVPTTGVLRAWWLRR